MEAIPRASILKRFSTIKDPGVDPQRKHQLQDIFFITLCGVICGADNWVAIEDFGDSKQEWFTDLLGLEHGIPPHDTLRRKESGLDTIIRSRSGVGSPTARKCD
ncbi:MAG: transposase family protein [Gammaproteobacteria bacterium]